MSNGDITEFSDQLNAVEVEHSKGLDHVSSEWTGEREGGKMSSIQIHWSLLPLYSSLFSLLGNSSS